VLDEHLDDEERDVLPLVAEHLSAAEWDDILARAHGAVPRKKMMSFMGAALEYAAPTERAHMLAQMPAPARVLWRIIGSHRYRTKARRLRSQD
jgi:hypothetical protein